MLRAVLKAPKATPVSSSGCRASRTISIRARAQKDSLPGAIVGAGVGTDATAALVVMTEPPLRCCWWCRRQLDRREAAGRRPRGRVRRARLRVARFPRHCGADPRRCATSQRPWRRVVGHPDPPLRQGNEVGDGPVEVDPPGVEHHDALASAATSSVWCVEMTIVDVAAISERTPRSDARCSGSRPVVGSSRTSSCGAPMSAWARATRRRWPPESRLIRFVVTSPSPTRSSTRRTSAARRTAVGPLLEHGHVVDEREGGETAGEAELLWLVPQPAPHVRAASGSIGSRPSSRTEPSSGRSTVAMTRSIVVLPAPFGPSSPVMPGPSSRSTSSSAARDR